MTQFSGKTVVAINQITTDNDTATNASTQRNHDEIFHTAGSAVRHFADGGSIRIIRQSYGNTA